MCYFKETIRFAVIAFGVIYLLTGVALISIGAIYNVTFNDLSKAIPESYNNLYVIPILTLVAGSLIIILTIFGCIAAFYNKHLLLIVYCSLLLGVFILQVITGIFTFLMVEDRNDFFKNLNTTIEEIFRNQNDTDLISLLQSQLHCCGTNGPNFWNTTINLPFPESCCIDENCSGIKQNGCQLAVYNFFLEAIKVVGTAVLAFSISEVTGAILALFMAQEVKNYKKINNQFTEDDDY